MKRVFFSALLFAAIQATAQDAIEQPRFVIGGTFNVSRFRSNDPQPSYGSGLGDYKQKGIYSDFVLYAMKNFGMHWSAGIQLTEQMSRNKYEQIESGGDVVYLTNYRDFLFGAGVYGRYTFNPANRIKFGINAGATLNRVLQSEEHSYLSGVDLLHNDGYGVQFKLSPVMIFDLNKRLRLTAEFFKLQYDYKRTEKRYSSSEDRQWGQSSNFYISNFLSGCRVGLEFKL